MSITLLAPTKAGRTRQPPGAEKRTRYDDVTWEQFKAMQHYVETWGGGRVSYLDGTLEHMTLSLEHENRKSLIGALLDVFLEEEEVPFFYPGSATLEKKSKRAGKEPDASYCFHRRNADRPDLAIEVAISRPALKTLEIYRRFEVPEVWVWQQDRLHIFHLEGGQYVSAPASRWFPKLPIARLEECARLDNAFEARKAFRAALRRRR